MTDPETASRTYVGPMTPQTVEEIIIKVRARATRRPRSARTMRLIDSAALSQLLTPAYTPQEKPDALLPTMGGQTALNLAVFLAEVRRSSVRRCCIQPL